MSCTGDITFAGYPAGRHPARFENCRLRASGHHRLSCPRLSRQHLAYLLRWTGLRTCVDGPLIRWRVARDSIRLLEEAIDQAVGAAAVGEGEMAGEIARRGCEVETLVLLVAAGQRAAGEIPRQAEDADALLGRHALGAGQVTIDQRPQLLVGHLRRTWRGEKIVRADQAQDLI